jgi:hypothetical protein
MPNYKFPESAYGEPLAPKVEIVSEVDHLRPLEVATTLKEFLAAAHHSGLPVTSMEQRLLLAQLREIADKDKMNAMWRNFDKLLQKKYLERQEDGADNNQNAKVSRALTHSKLQTHAAVATLIG